MNDDYTPSGISSIVLPKVDEPNITQVQWGTRNPHFQSCFKYVWRVLCLFTNKTAYAILRFGIFSYFPQALQDVGAIHNSTGGSNVFACLHRLFFYCKHLWITQMHYISWNHTVTDMSPDFWYLPVCYSCPVNK